MMGTDFGGDGGAEAFCLLDYLDGTPGADVQDVNRAAGFEA